MAARYWRILGIQTPSNNLALGALAISDGTTDYPTATLTGMLSPSFSIGWDLGSAVGITQIKLTAIVRSGFPTTLFLESSVDNLNWEPVFQFETLIYLGDATQATVVILDLYFASTELLLHCDGSNGSTAIISSSAKYAAVTAFGDAKISTSQSRFGGSSLVFDGAGDYAEVQSPSNFEFGSSDWTLEFWLNTSTTTTYAGTIGRDTGTFPAGAWSLLLNGNGSGSIQLWCASYSLGSPLLSSAAVGVNDGAWHHIVVVRNASAWAIYKDGVSIASNTWSGAIAPIALKLTLGTNPGYPGRYFAGYIDEVRITNGVARYTTNFTPPTTAASTHVSGVTDPVITGRSTDSGVTSLGDGGTMPDGCTSCASGGAAAIDMIDGGTAHLTGTIAEKNTPTNTPLSRRVALIDEATRRTIRETWSDNNGDYAFPDIADRIYTVLAYDHTHDYRAVVADNITPEPMP